MIRERLKYQNAIHVITDVMTILLSYILAVFIRYEIMSSKPGLDTLSAPYLLIALLYSLILASVFRFIRGTKGRTGGYDGIELLSINAIGCLFLLAFFYTIGEYYFSRLALIMFWLISSAMLEIKRILLSAVFEKRYRKLTSNVKVLLVGGGAVTDQYIRSIGWDEACEFNIIGYVGKQYGIFFDYPFHEETEAGNLISQGWLGGFDDFEDVLEKEKPDEVVFAVEDEELYQLKELIPIARARQMKISIVPSFNQYIPRHAVIRRIDDISIVDLADGEEESTSGIYCVGLTLTGILLLMMLIIKRFHVGNLDSFVMYENYRCFIFSVAAFFVFQCLGVRKTKNPMTAAVITGTVSFLFIVVYERIYTEGVGLVQNTLTDVKMTMAIVVLVWILKSIMGVISSDDAWNLM